MKIPKRLHRPKFGNKGFGHVELFIAVIVIAGVALIGYRVLQMSHAQTACTINPTTLVDNCRPLVGAAAKGNPGLPNAAKSDVPGTDLISQFNYLEKLTGSKLDVMRTYETCQDSGSCGSGPLPFAPKSAQATMADTAGKYVDLNWKPVSHWANADGSDSAVNAEIKQVADNIKQLNKPVFLTVWHEPENDVSKWDQGNDGAAEQSYCTGTNKPANFAGLHGNAGTPDQYKAMWVNVQKIFKQEGTTNVVWTYDTMGYPGLECLIPELKPANVSWWLSDVYGHKTTFDATAGKIYNYVQTNPDGVNFTNLAGWGLGEYNDCNNTEAGAVAYFDGAKAAFDANTYPKYKMYLLYADTSGPNNGSGGCLSDYGLQTPGDGNSPRIYEPQKQQAINAFFADLLKNNSKGTQPSVSVSITGPSNGAMVKGTVNVGVSASSNVTRSQVEWDGNIIRAATSKDAYGWGSQWDSTKAPNGTHTLSVTVWDAAGDSKTATITVNVDNPAPLSVSITSPSNGATINGVVTIGVDASSNVTKSQVSWDSTGIRAATATDAYGWGSQWDSTKAPNGTHTLSVTVWDAAGDSKTATITVNVDNPAPVNHSGPVSDTKS